MDVLKNFPNRVWLGSGNGGFWQSMEYENIPKYCTKCLRQGHTLAGCKREENRKNVVGPNMHINQVELQHLKIMETNKVENEAFQQIHQFDKEIGGSSEQINFNSAQAIVEAEVRRLEIREG